jgi:hypothetical protein
VIAEEGSLKQINAWGYLPSGRSIFKHSISPPFLENNSSNSSFVVAGGKFFT